MADEEETVTVFAEAVIADTAKAVLILTVDGEEVWIPRVCIAGEEAYETFKGDEGIELDVSMWFAKKNNLY